MVCHTMGGYDRDDGMMDGDVLPAEQHNSVDSN